MRRFVGRVVEDLGLDWLRALSGKPAFQDPKLPFPEGKEEVRAQFGDLQDDEKLNDAIGYCTGLLKREEERADKIESKAFTLIGISGIAVAFITGFAGLLLDRGRMPSGLCVVPGAVLYFLVVAALAFTVYLAVRVVTVGPEFKFSYPSANDIFELSKRSLADVRRDRVVSLFCSFAHNSGVANRKATYLAGAQLWFRNSIGLLVVLTLTLALYASFRP